MTLDPFLQELSDFSEAKESFPLRDFRDTLHPDADLFTLLRSLLPPLSLLGLGWREEKKGFTIYRIPRPGLFAPDERDLSKLEKRLAGGEFPPGIQRVIEEYIGMKTGKPWDDPVTLQRIRASVMQQKSQYWRGGDERRIGYRKGYAVFAYLAYQSPVTYFQFSHLFVRLVRQGLIRNSIRILDAGAGPGIVPLALSGLLQDLPGLSAEVFALERSEEFIDAYSRLVPGSANERVVVNPPVRGDLRQAGGLLLPSSLDLVVFQNVLNELPGTSPDKARVISSLSRLLVPGGCMALIEPADKDNSTALRETVRAAAGKGLAVRDPCRFLRAGSCRAGPCWSFLEKPPIRPTRLMRALSGEKEAFRFENTDIKFSYAVLVQEQEGSGGAPATVHSPSPPLSSLRKHAGERINLTAAVISGDLGDRENHVFLLCDASGTAYAILPRYHVTGSNKTLLSVPYAAVVELRGVLVRYNPRRKAWNLLLTGSSEARVVGC
jgi:SAM-dependent methyltransferase